MVCLVHAVLAVLVTVCLVARVLVVVGEHAVRGGVAITRHEGVKARVWDGGSEIQVFIYMNTGSL